MAADGSVIIDTRMDTTGVQNGVSAIKQSFNGLGSAVKKIGLLIGGAFAVGKLVQFGKECVELGSDLTEVQNVVDVTFTTMSDKVNEFAKNAMTSAGLSETMAKRYVGTFGAMSKSFGFSEAQAYDMSTALTQLTGDVASFYNISQDLAYIKLKSVFTGETETLKDLGVVMTQSALDQYALANGYGKTTSAIHTAYANSIDGTVDFSTTDTDRIYIGHYSDFEKADSADPAKYTWARMRGEDGPPGRTYYLRANTEILLMGQDKKVTPEKLTVNVYYRDGQGEETAYAGWWKAERSTDSGKTWTTITLNQTEATGASNKTVVGALNELNGKLNVDTETISYTDSEWSSLGGIDECVKDAVNKNRIPIDGMFYKQFTAGVRYLMLGYRYANGKYGTIILYKYDQTGDVRYSITNGDFFKVK